MGAVDPSIWLQLGFLGVLGVFAVGVWRIAKPAADEWLAQYRSLLAYTLEMVGVMANINANLERLDGSYGHIEERLIEHEQSTERRYDDVMRDLGNLSRQITE